MTEPRNLTKLIQSLNANAVTPPKRAKSSDVDDETKRAKKIKNDNAVSDQKMKEKTLNWLFGMLFLEIIGIFTIAILQGFGNSPCFNFHIEEWCFTAIISGVIAQTAFMVSVAVKHLFPNKDKKNNKPAGRVIPPFLPPARVG